MLRECLVQAASDERFRRLVGTVTLPRAVMGRLRLVGGVEEAVLISQGLVRDGLTATIDRLAVPPVDLAEARAGRDHALLLLQALAEAGAGATVQITVDPVAVGLALGSDGERIALEHVFELAAAAAGLGTAITLGPASALRVGAVLGLAAQVRAEYPGIGVTLLAGHRRTVMDARDLAASGARVVLVRRAALAPPGEGIVRRADLDRAFVRALRILIDGSGDLAVATSDRLLVEIAEALAAHRRRPLGSVEVLWPYGLRSAVLNERAGRRPVRVGVPFGPVRDEEWVDSMLASPEHGAEPGLRWGRRPAPPPR